MLQWMTMNVNVSAWLLNQWLDRYDRLYTQVVLLFNPLDSKGNYSATSHNTIKSWYTGCWWVGCYIWYSEERPEWAAAPPSPLLAVPNVTALLSTASVPITVLLYDGPWELKGTNSHMQKTGVNEHGSRFSAVDPLWPNSAECCCSAADSVRQMIDGIVL